MKNKKMKLGDLKVQSFVTNLENGDKQTLQGGNHAVAPTENGIPCDFQGSLLAVISCNCTHAPCVTQNEGCLDSVVPGCQKVFPI